MKLLFWIITFFLLGTYTFVIFTRPFNVTSEVQAKQNTVKHNSDSENTLYLIVRSDSSPLSPFRKAINTLTRKADRERVICEATSDDVVLLQNEYSVNLYEKTQNSYADSNDTLTDKHIQDLFPDISCTRYSIYQHMILALSSHVS